MLGLKEQAAMHVQGNSGIDKPEGEKGNCAA